MTTNTPDALDDLDDLAVHIDLRAWLQRCRRQWYLFAWTVPLFAIWGVYFGQMAHVQGLDSAYSFAHFSDERAAATYAQNRTAEQALEANHRAETAAADALVEHADASNLSRRLKLAELYADEVDKDVIRSVTRPPPPVPTTPNLPQFRPVMAGAYGAAGGFALVAIGLFLASMKRARR